MTHLSVLIIWLLLLLLLWIFEIKIIDTKMEGGNFACGVGTGLEKKNLIWVVPVF